METRTELILLQRTMVVVEGVARSLSPHMNIWEDAQPIVESYIADSIGPKALMRDLAKTALVLSRFGPRLPELAQAALIRQTNPIPEPRQQTLAGRLGWMGLGGAVVGIAVVVIQAL